MQKLGVRLAITIAVPVLFYVLSPYLSLPGVETMLFPVTRQSASLDLARRSLGMFALGVVPMLSGYGVVELIAYLVPRWSRLRHGDPAGRAKLERAARAVAIVLAIVQAYAIALQLRTLMYESAYGTAEVPPTWLLVASLAGGACVVVILADVVTRMRIVNGYLLFVVVGAIPEITSSIGGSITKASITGELGVRTFVVLGLAFVLPAIATVIVLRMNRGGIPTLVGGAAGLYRDGKTFAIDPVVPIPSSSVVAVSVATSLLVLPSFLNGLGIDANALATPLANLRPFPYACVLFGATAVVSLVLTRLLHRPREAVDLASRLGFDGDPKIARAAVMRSLPPTILFFAVLVWASGAAASAKLHAPSVLVVPLVVALGLDAIAAVKTASQVVVWRELRIEVVPLVRAALAGDGIASEARGLGAASLFQIFAPYAPAEIVVPEPDAARAEKLLAHVMLGADKPLPNATERPTPPPPSAPRRPTLTLAITAVVAIAACIGAGIKLAPPPSGPRPKLELLRVDDVANPLEALAKSGNFDIRSETVSVRGSRGKVFYVRRGRWAGERVEEAIDRLRESTSTIAVPPGTRFGFEAIHEPDPESGPDTLNVTRTFLLTGDPILTTDDVTEAEPALDSNLGLYGVYVAVTLSSAAAERFEDATAHWVDRRIAIVIDGRIMSAPIVKSRIPGGHISITLGDGGDPEQQLASARLLARALSPR